MSLSLLLDLRGNLWGMLWVATLLFAFKSTLFTYAAAKQAKLGNPGRWALGVALSFVGTAFVGYPVFPVVMAYIAVKHRPWENRREREAA